MARPASQHPTELELEILKVIWRDGACTVRNVREALAPTRKLAHTSVITVMNIMVEKNYLSRDTDAASHVFRAKVKPGFIKRRMLSDMLRRVFDGSASAMVLNLLETSELKADELAELRRLIDEKDKDKEQV